MDGRRVDRLPVVHFLTPSVEVEWVRYALAGGSLFQTELFIAEVGSKPLVRANAREEADQSLEIVGWTPDGSELLFLRLNREHSVLDLMAADPATGTTRTTVK